MESINNKSKVIKIWLILSLTSFLIGTTIAFMSAYNFFDNNKQVSIIEVNDKTIKVQSGEQNGDPIIYEIKRYKILNKKENDKIYIKIKDNKAKYSLIQIGPDKIEKIALILMIAPILIIVLYIWFLVLMLFPIYIIKSSNNRIVGTIIYIMCWIGMILCIINKDNVWNIIGILLMIVPGTIWCIIKEKKHKKHKKHKK